MKILISGSTGFVGSALARQLCSQGHHIVHLVRRGHAGLDGPVVRWNVEAGTLDARLLEGLDAVIHLAGESIMGRWTPEKKARIRRSRVEGTRLLAGALAGLNQKPKALICASAIGYYGDRGAEVLTEVSASGDNFLAQVCRQWEQAAEPSREAGIRVAHARIGVVLAPSGGAFKLMYWPFRLGLAGNLGNGQQYMSWITLADTVNALEHILMTESLRGPVNVVAPHPVTNAAFTRTLHRVLTPPFLPGRYWAPPAPALALKLLAGQMANETLLASQRVLPVRLQETGFIFQYSRLEEALRALV